MQPQGNVTDPREKKIARNRAQTTFCMCQEGTAVMQNTPHQLANTLDYAKQVARELLAMQTA
eukprot:1855817-Rhodomonas_salina.1